MMKPNSIHLQISFEGAKLLQEVITKGYEKNKDKHNMMKNLQAQIAHKINVEEVAYQRRIQDPF